MTSLSKRVHLNKHRKKNEGQRVSRKGWFFIDCDGLSWYFPTKKAFLDAMVGNKRFVKAEEKINGDVLKND